MGLHDLCEHDSIVFAGIPKGEEVLLMEQDGLADRCYNVVLFFECQNLYLAATCMNEITVSFLKFLDEFGEADSD